MNSTPEPFENTPADAPVNATGDGAVNTDPAATETATTRAGNVVPIRPDTARTADEIPEQDRFADAGTVLDSADVEAVDASGQAAPLKPVDPATVKPSWWETVSDATARPLVAKWLTSAEEFRSRARFLVRYAAHTFAFHALRVPVYVPTALLRAPGALCRLTARVGRWMYDAESKPVRMNARDRNDADTYMKLREARNETVRRRSAPVMVAIVVLLATVYLCWTFVAPVWNWTLLLATLTAVGWWGAPQDKPVAGRAVDAVKTPKLTSAMIEDALCSLGIGGLNQAIAKGKRIEFPNPIARDGDGWRADIDLPLGVTAGDIIAKRQELSSALRRQIGCVWPEGDAKVHEGRLVLWVGDRDMSKAKQKPWPLAKPGATVDLFKPQPFGTDQRGRWVDVTLMFVSVIIGAVPRMGKTVTLRELMMIAALDPRAVLYSYDLKGTGDLSPLAPCSHAYGVGDEPDDVERMLVEMRELREEMRRRTKVIRALPESVCPDNKVTPELAARKDLRLAPIVVGVDECQVWFEHDKHGAEFEEICVDLAKRGPALGIILILATQRPDAKSLPTGISANAILRYCLKVQGHTENDMVLGTGQHKNGVRATMFARSDRGIGYLVGEGDDAKIVRSVYKDATDAKKIAAGARARREAIGNITGYAAGESVDVEAARLDPLADTLSVFERGEDKLWSDTIVTRLADLRPSQYGGWTAQNLATALKPTGVKPKQVWSTDPATGKGANRNGYARDALIAAKNDGA
ncbi:FtsK/SpoIIIE domain-containing protein [Amycolatopsis nalaikhensis]|uniref:FtsK/SpoIIIE domain-containing protein n=1 Tax=Amycolatopsis nalaikhensis TaxID=715472 RepID=A0ABY8XWN7_9PSEU|nr:FtsK/SpoIIIE domain-containing protein [Amycolatopsis sp. 2-2]WIV60017.1 FtsK/SpoIIIE domain-containing protein [Amycolatopsis sp. 2-2]